MKSLTLSKIVSAALVVVALGFAGTAFASHSWGNYHWARTANPFTLKMGDNVSAAWDGYLTTTSNAWSVSDVLDTTIVAGLGGRNCKAQTGRIEVCNRTYGYNGWIGLAQIYVSGSHITKGVAKMNDSYFNLAFYNTPEEKLHVMCQEVGHVFGLGHTTEDGSSQGTCMDYSSSASSTLPNAHDYEQLAAIYAHLDGFTTIAPLEGDGGNGNGKGKPAGVGQDIDLNDPAAWGRAIKQDARGNNSLYVRDLGGDEKLFTFVIWAR